MQIRHFRAPLCAPSILATGIALPAAAWAQAAAVQPTLAGEPAQEEKEAGLWVMV